MDRSQVSVTALRRGKGKDVESLVAAEVNLNGMARALVSLFKYIVTMEAAVAHCHATKNHPIEQHFQKILQSHRECATLFSNAYFILDQDAQPFRDAHSSLLQGVS